MAELEVVPAALVSAAAAVRCFSVDLEPVVLGGDALSSALTAEFESRWGQALRALAAEADSADVALREAAAHYAQLERLLVPR